VVRLGLHFGRLRTAINIKNQLYHTRLTDHCLTNGANGHKNIFEVNPKLELPITNPLNLMIFKSSNMLFLQCAILIFDNLLVISTENITYL